MTPSTDNARGDTYLSRLFPTHYALFIFVSYMILSINLGILVTSSQQVNNEYLYNVTTVVLLVELVKLVMSLAFYLTNANISSLVEECWQYRKVVVATLHYSPLADITAGVDGSIHASAVAILSVVYCLGMGPLGCVADTLRYSSLLTTVLALYLVPGALYCLYNNLAFTNLSTFDPTTYFLLMQLRVLVTGVIYQVLFKKYLSRTQWLALLVLTIGCVVKQLDVSVKQLHTRDVVKALSDVGTTIASQPLDMQLSLGFLLLFVQLLCSCLAGVFNERLLKGHSGQASVQLQNIFMYVDSSICNVALLAATGELRRAFNGQALAEIVLVPKVAFIVLNNAALGLVTSVFLKTLNSILKVFASALEPMFLALLCFVIFGHRITVYTVCSLVLVSGATLLYATSPLPLVGQQAKTTEDDTDKEKAKGMV